MAALEFTRRYAMAHRLLADPNSKCIVPHGHNEFVTIRLAPQQMFTFGDANSLAPFETLKRRWHGWIDGAVDHALQLNAYDPLIEHFRAHEPHILPRLMVFQGDPTTEALAAAFWLKADAFLAAESVPFEIESVRVEETPTNAVVLTRAVFDPGDCGLAEETWPRRADMSINDL